MFIDSNNFMASEEMIYKYFFLNSAFLVAMVTNEFRGYNQKGMFGSRIISLKTLV